MLRGLDLILPLPEIRFSEAGTIKIHVLDTLKIEINGGPSVFRSLEEYRCQVCVLFLGRGLQITSEICEMLFDLRFLSVRKGGSLSDLSNRAQGESGE